MIGICEHCILFDLGRCHAENEPEKIAECVTHCDYYLFNCSKSSFQEGFIKGFEYCNKMKKQPVIERIENRAKQEVFNKLIEILNNNQFPDYVEGELIVYLRNEGCNI